ncbi:solute carrier family 2, facilitated glucose transporter member 7 [Perognathus longimembris pacificus]|uniref:solute carrier family 2, facilitated glucose transporter member 7 n=1 Tax=Perognathus longimembris pacificus TaxID=214514 RepID=UPI0020190881|nr:solute carrier family 2, facilitated glucose transporter member 7 [Perognathus longimembris pacificus]
MEVKHMTKEAAPHSQGAKEKEERNSSQAPNVTPSFPPSDSSKPRNGALHQERASHPSKDKEMGTPLPTLLPEGRLPPTLLLATLSAAFGSAFQYGYNTAVVNTPHKVLKSFYNNTYFERHGTFLEERALQLLWSCSVSVFALGGLLGSLIAGLLVDRCGRKGTLLINNVFAIVPAILMGVSKVARAFELIIFSRVLVGVCAGITYSALPMYLGELAPRDLRGALGIMTEVFAITGIFLAQIFSLQVILGNATGWPVLLALTGVPALVQLLTLPFFPESPRYTLIQKGDEEAARRALGRLRGRRADLEAEVEDMRAEARAECAGGRLSVLRLLAYRPLRWQLLSVVVLMAGQQLSGVNAINYYADTIYTAAGVEATHSQYVTVGAGAVNIAMTLVSAGIVERVGRRLLLLVGYGICACACLVLTASLLFQDTVPQLAYLGIICVFTYISGHSIGPSPIPAVVRTEIFLQSSRRAAFTVDGAVHWSTNFLVGLLFPSMQAAIGAYSFIVFAGLCLLTAVYVYVVIPETKGRTFVEINHSFARRNGVEIPEQTGDLAEGTPL